MTTSKDYIKIYWVGNYYPGDCIYYRKMSDIWLQLGREGLDNYLNADGKIAIREQLMDEPHDMYSCQRVVISCKVVEVISVDEAKKRIAEAQAEYEVKLNEWKNK